MHKSVQVSVIVAAKNSQLYIGRCLRSLLNQSFDQDKYEVIVINDGSTDNSENIIEARTAKPIKIGEHLFLVIKTFNNTYLLSSILSCF